MRLESSFRATGYKVFKYLGIVLLFLPAFSAVAIAKDLAQCGIEQYTCDAGCYSSVDPFSCKMQCLQELQRCNDNASNNRDYESDSYDFDSGTNNQYRGSTPSYSPPTTRQKTYGRIDNPSSGSGPCISANTVNTKKNTQLKPYCHSDYKGCFDKLHGVSFSNSCNVSVTVKYTCGNASRIRSVSPGRTETVWAGEMKSGCRGNFRYNSYTYGNR